MSGLVDEIRQLGLRHGILTEFTAYLVQEPDAVAAAPAPREERQRATGQAAFERASRSAKLRDVSNLDAAAAADEAAPAAAPAASGVKRQAGRVFHLVGGTWTDAGYPNRMRVTAIAPYSRAYFDLVRMLPEIAPYLSVGEEVLIAGQRIGIRIGPGGTSELGSTELSALVRDFRGT